MLFTPLLICAAFLLVAHVATQDEKNPLEILAAVFLVAIALAVHVGSGRPALLLVGRLSLELGIASTLAAGFIARKRGQARPFFAMGIMAMTLAVVLLGTNRLLDARAEVVTLLVELGPDDNIEEIQASLDRFGARAERAFPDLTLEQDEDLAQTFIVFVKKRLEAALRALLGLDTENVDFVEPNRLLSLDLPVAVEEFAPVSVPALENDPLVDRQWALEAIGAHGAHRLLVDEQPVRKARVAIIDTGVDATHEDVRSAFASSPAGTDAHGHGTHCAGIAGAVTNNGVGIASLNWEGRFVEVVSYAALDRNGQGSIEQIAQAVIDAARDGADVLSLSLGEHAPATPRTLAVAFRYARNQGTVIVASAGNSNRDAVDHIPSNLEGVIAVAAVDASLRKAAFSNTVSSLTRGIAAPGVAILSLKPGGGYVDMSGTSMAAPMVAGVIGIMRSLDPRLDDATLYSILVETGRSGPDQGATGPVIDAEAAIRTVLDGR